MSNTISQLDPLFTSMISNIMYYERQPLYRMQQQQDTLNLRTQAYREVDDKLSALQDAVQALRSSNYSTALAAGRSSAISNVAEGYTVLSASVSSSALVGTYDVAVTDLARAHRVRSDQQVYSNQALGLSGEILIGGAAARSASTVSTIANTVTGLATNANLTEGQSELGTGSYYVETRYNEGWQFRLVDANGEALSIANVDEAGEFTSNWQAIPTAETFNTGRGLEISFGADSELFQAAARGSGAAQVDYTAQGATISISAGDTLNAIAAKINEGDYAAGNGVTATVIDRQLVLSATDTGLSHSIIASDATGSVLETLGVLTGVGAFKNEMQTGLDASFTVNGIPVTRSRNTGLTDVISGVTLNLAPDAQEQSATLAVSEDWSGARSAIDEFIDQFNEILNYIESQTELTETSSGDTPTYSRGPLGDENIFSELRGDLFSMFLTQYSNDGQYTSLRDLGITMGDSLRASLSDSAALEAALADDPDSVIALMDSVMEAFDTKLSGFTGDGGVNGYLDGAVQSISSQIAGLGQDITSLTQRLDEREAYLTDQYAEMQATLLSLSYSQQMWSGIYGSVNRYS